MTDQEANRPKCLKGTRVDLLQQIRTWAQRTEYPNVFLLTGGAGTGKSTVARTIAEEFKAGKSLGCYIFFERGKTDSLSITNTVIKTIAYHLACHYSVIAETLSNLIKDDQELSFPSSDILFDSLLYNPLHSISTEYISNPILVVLDALDECGDSEAQESLANLLKNKTLTLPPNIRFLITSRPEEGIAPLLSSASLQSRICEYVKLNHTSESSKKEVVYYIRHELEKLRDENRIIVKGNWDWDENIDKLGCAAEGLFIWASTAIKFINEVKAGRFNRLRKLVNDTKGVGMNLDKLYATVLENCIDWKDDEMKEVFSSVFSLILFGKTPLSDVDIDDILDYEEGTTMDVISGLHSLVVFEPGQPIRIHHTSLYDYLTSTRCDDVSWFIDADVEKSRIVSRCFGLMKNQLRFNICDLETSFKFNRDVPDLEKRVNERIQPGLLYACRHWASHLRDIPYSSEILSELDNFMYKQLLYWLEVLSLTGCLYEYFKPVLETAIEWAKVSSQTFVQVQKLTREQDNERHVPYKLLSFLEDALQHVFEFIQPISESTPHLYMTFLPFKKSESDVASHYAKYMNELTCIEYIGDKVKATTGCISHCNVGSSVRSLYCIGDRVVSGSPSGICLWDVDNGELIKGPFGGDASISYFTKYEVANQDLVNEWDIYAAELAYSGLTLDIGRVTSVSSAFQQYLAAGFENGAIQLWDHAEKTALDEPLRGHSGKVLALAFGKVIGLYSHQGGRLKDYYHAVVYLASGSEDQTIIIWNVKRQGKKYASLKGHSGPVTSLEFMSLGGELVSGSLDGTIRIWEVFTGNTLHIFSASGMGGVYSVVYYADRHILSGSEDGIVRMWDAKHSEVPPKKFVGHTSKVTSLSVDYIHGSKRFVSGSSDGTIRLWEHRECKIVKRLVDAMAVSPNGEYLVSGSGCATVSVWRIETNKLINGPLEGHTSWVTSLSFSPDGFHFASGSKDGTVRIWNLVGYPLTCSTEGHQVRAVCFSPDGKHVASGTDESILVWDSQNGRLVLKIFEGHSNLVESIYYSPDGNRIVSGSRDKGICFWDASNGTLLQTLPGQVTSLKYSHDGSYIVSVSKDGLIRFWDANNGKPVRKTIKVEEGEMDSVRFSPDGTYFISVSRDYTARVCDTSTGKLLFKVNVLSSNTNPIVLLPSSDSKYIKFASASYTNGLIRIYCVDIDSKGVISDIPDKDGWLVGNDGNLLSWVPSDIRHSLIYGSCVGILNSRFSAKLTLSKYQGNQWTSCFPSSSIV